MRIEPFHINTFSTIQYDASIAYEKDGPIIMILRFWGEYRHGPAGHLDARFMLGVTKQILTMRDIDGVLFDLRKLSIPSNDSILNVLQVEYDPELAPLPRGVVISTIARSAYEQITKSSGVTISLFHDVEKAISGLCDSVNELTRLEDENENKLRMYVLLRETVPSSYALPIASRAALFTYMQFADTWETKLWFSNSCKMIVCVTNKEEFMMARQIAHKTVIVEPSLGNEEVALGFKPRAKWPKNFQFYRLYK